MGPDAPVVIAMCVIDRRRPPRVNEKSRTHAAPDRGCFNYADAIPAKHAPPAGATTAPRFRCLLCDYKLQKRNGRVENAPKLLNWWAV